MNMVGPFSAKRIAGAFAALLLLLVVPMAIAGAMGPHTALEGLIKRPAGFEPLPRAKPRGFVAAPRNCQLATGDQLWSSLPLTLRTVPLRAMIGQLLMVSYSGDAPRSRGVIVARDALRRSEIGGVLTFRHNIASADRIRAINDLFQNAHPVLPPFIAVDQEGGVVMRVKPTEGAPKTPSARDIAKGSPQAASDAYAQMANALSDLGFTVNFGPVVDLSVNPKNPVIARFGRSYGEAPQKVVAYARTFIETHKELGIATSLKHFPGHGSSTADSHDRAIDLTPTWSSRELEPFEELISDGEAQMIMVGHLMLDGLSGPGNLPASLSPIAIDGVLRGEMCFDGLVVSDDLAMDAVESNWNNAEAARLMIEAGGDIVLVSLPAKKGMEVVREITDHLAEEAAKSPALKAKIRHAYARVVRQKLAMAAIRRGKPVPEEHAPPKASKALSAQVN